MLVTEKGMVVRWPVKDVRTTGRSTQGVRLMKLDAQDVVASMARIVPEDDAEKVAEAAPAAASQVSEKTPEPKAETKEAVKEVVKGPTPEKKIAEKTKTEKIDKVKKAKKK
jgi:DNA gyrase subunit A